MNDTKVMNLAADNIRILAASMVEKAKSGHPGGAMGGADFINVLYSEYLQYDPANPKSSFFVFIVINFCIFLGIFFRVDRNLYSCTRFIISTF